MQYKTPSSLANLLQHCIDHKAHKSGRIIQACLTRTNQLSNTFLANRLIDLYSKCGHTSSARNLFDHIPARNIFSYHAVLDSYCKSNDLRDACDLFSRMPERNEVSWNLMISLFSRNELRYKALESYCSMRLSGFLPNRFTLASVLSSCGGLGSIEYGRECHGIAVKLGLDENLYVANALLGMYMKCESISDAFTVFKDLPDRNEVSFTAMMKGMVDVGRVDEAFSMFGMMHREGIIDCVSASSVLGVCSKSAVEDCGRDDVKSCNMEGEQVHGLVVKLGLDRDMHVNNSLLDMYAKNGDMDCAEVLFKSMSEISIVSWNVMISGYGKQLDNNRAIECLERMQIDGFEPDEITYVNTLSACLKSGDVETGFKVFNSMPVPSLASWNAIISGYSQNESHNEAVMLFREMQFRTIRPDRTTFAVILSSCAEMGLLGCGKQIHGALVRSRFDTDLYVASGLIGVYSKCGKIEEAKHIFEQVPETDIVCYNSMLAGLSHNSLHTESFTFFCQMVGKGMMPTEFSYSTVLNSCSALTCLSRGRQLHGMILKHALASDVYVGTSLINVYCKSGDIDGARQFFDSMTCKSTVTWNEMIHGYAQNGQGQNAVNLFETMIRTVFKPDSITLVSVLIACSHSGLVDYGLNVFDSMQKEHNIVPISDHYTCIIDSLGRAGRFNEIEHIIGEMQYRDDPVIWEVLLSSCRVHGNVDLARRAASELLRLDPSNSAPYSLLANMYSSLNRWDDVKDVRDVMDEVQVFKEPAYSWI